MLLGSPGFIESIDPQTIEVDLTKIILNPDDPLWANIQIESQIGILAIEFASRRRLRINCKVACITSDRLQLNVLEFYPNCPKYIQRRQLVNNPDSAVAKQSSEPQFGQFLTSEHQHWIRSADTLFVASVHP